MSGYRRPSIYDRLQKRTAARQDKAPPAPRHFDTQSMAVAHAWLLGGFGDTDELAPGMPAPAGCDYTFDERVRNAADEFMGVYRIGTGRTAELAPGARARQLLEYALPGLLAQGDRQAWGEGQIVLQHPAGTDPQAWLDTVLALWPVHRQPRHGMRVTRLTFDQWLRETLAASEGTIECYQFIAVTPLGLRPIRTGHPNGEALASLWLRRPTKEHAPGTNTPHTAHCRLSLPGRHEHPPRHLTRRDDPALLERAVATALPQDDARQAIGALVWAGVTGGNRLDQLTALLQRDFPHLHWDTDVWSLQGLCGSMDTDTTPYQLAVALRLAEQRARDTLVLDCRGDDTTVAMHLAGAETATNPPPERGGGSLPPSTRTTGAPS